MKHYYFSAALSCQSGKSTLYVVDHDLVDQFNYEIADNWLYDVLPVRDRKSRWSKFIDLDLVPETQFSPSFHITLVTDKVSLYGAIACLREEQDLFFERRKDLF